MDLQLTGKHVLVTGGSRGIGLACAKLFLEEGAAVTITSRSLENLENACGQLRCIPNVNLCCLPADLRDAQAALAMVDAVEAGIGPIDVLVNSAGAAQRTPFTDLSPEAWQAAMQAKFFTYINVIDPLVKRMGERGNGVIVNVIGTGGKLALPTHLPGGAANAALMLTTAGLAAAWAPRGVRVNAVNPSLTRTDRLQEGLEAQARQQGQSIEEALAQAVSRIPLGRLAQPAEVANVVAFLASPLSAYVTGAIVGIDGGAIPTVV